MNLLREIQSAMRDGLDDLLGAGAERDEVDTVLALLESDLNEAKSELELAVQDERRLRARIEQERRDADRLRDRAKDAVDKGDEDAGRELIRRRRRTLRGVEILEQQWVEHQALIGQLHDHIDSLEDKLQELRLRRDFLRTRGRVAALRERYERYRRDFGLDSLPGPDDPEGIMAEDEALFDEDETEAELDVERIIPSDEPDLPPEPRRGRAEVPPHDDGDETVLRRRRRREPEAEEADEAWDRPPVNVRLERERILRDIERQVHRPEFDDEIEDELRKLKGEQPSAEEPSPAPVAAMPPDAGQAPAGEQPGTAAMTAPADEDEGAEGDDDVS